MDELSTGSNIATENERERRASFTSARRKDKVVKQIAKRARKTLHSSAINDSQRMFIDVAYDDIIRSDGLDTSQGIKKMVGRIAMRYLWARYVDTFLLSFVVITTVSIKGILLAIVALVVLDIRWAAGHLSERVPKMLLPHSMFLGFVHLVLLFIFTLLGLLLITGYCFVSQPGQTALWWVNIKESPLDSCF